MEDTNPKSRRPEGEKIYVGLCDCVSHCLLAHAFDDLDTVDLTILTTGGQPLRGRIKEAWRHILHDELNHTSVCLDQMEAWKLVDFLQREFLPPARTDGQTLEMNSKALESKPDYVEMERGFRWHTYWGFTPAYIREPDYEDDPTRWFNTLKEAQEFRGKHNLLAKMVEDDLKILGLPLNDHELTRHHRTPDYMELKDTWEHATLKIAKKLSIVPPDYDRVDSRASQEMPQHVDSEFLSRHVNLTVDGVRGLL